MSRNDNTGKRMDGQNYLQSDRFLELETFDKLDPGVRDLLRDLPFNESTVPVFDHIDQGKMTPFEMERHLFTNYVNLVFRIYQDRGFSREDATFLTHKLMFKPR